MAIKQKCIDLKIELTELNKKGKTIEKKLHSLIDELSKLEPNKKINRSLHFLRDMRNRVMHPDRHSFSGPIAKNIILSSVNILNKIFIPEATLQSFQEELLRIQKQLHKFSDQVLIFEIGEKKYLLEKIEVREALIIENKWTYLMVLHPIPFGIKSQIQDQTYSLPFIYDIDELKIDSDITCRIIDTDKQIRIFVSGNKDNLATYMAFKAEIESSEEGDKFLYLHNTKIELAKAESRFLYRYLHKVSF